MKTTLLLLITIALFTCCSRFDYYSIDEFNYDKTAQNNIDFFVEGGITTQLTHHKIKIQKPGSYAYNTEPEFITNAKVYIKSDYDTIKFELIETLNGNALYQPYYKSIIKTKAEIGRSYTLVIEYNNKTYTATDSVFDVGDIVYNEIRLPLKSTNVISDDYSFYVKKHDFGYAKPYYWAWFPIAFYDEPVSNFLQEGSITNYTHRGAEPQGVFATQYYSEIGFGGIDDSILTVKFSLSESYYNYLRALFMETNWSESEFSSISGNLPTNFSEGGSGFFFASACTTKHITVQELLKLNETKDTNNF